MVPIDEIEIEDEDYIKTSASIAEGSVTMSDSIDSDNDQIDRINLGDSMPSSERTEWCSSTSITSPPGGDKTHINIQMNDNMAEKMVESLIDFHDLDFDRTD